MKNKTIAVDLAKSVFEVGVSGRAGHVDACHRLSRKQFKVFFVKQEPAKVVMEACGSAHHWGRWLTELGHEVELLPPAYVRPYVLRDKTDRTDVQGLLEASRNRGDRRPVEPLDRPANLPGETGSHPVGQPPGRAVVQGEPALSERLGKRDQSSSLNGCLSLCGPFYPSQVPYNPVPCYTNLQIPWDLPAVKVF